jgi:hypothetical protein
VILCTVCTMHMKTRSVGILVEPQNQGQWFSDLDLKITVMVSWFGHQNQAGFVLSVTPQNQRREDFVEHASRSNDFLRREASQGRISLSDLKTGGGTMMSGARGIIMNVASSGS